jgi:hypothetical protein
MRSHNVGALLPARTAPSLPASGVQLRSVVPSASVAVLASDMIHGRLVDDAARDVADAWARAHGK